MSEWQNEFTRCAARKKDGTKCKLYAPPDELFCEHHAFDVRSFIRTPNEVINLYAKYFPKQHHPACDRKGQNDCDCPDLPLATLTARVIKRCFDTSLKQTPEWKEHQRLTMNRRTKAIRKYYEKIDHAELWLPPYAQWRQYRFFVWDRKEQRIRVTKLQDNFRNTNEGLKALKRRLIQYAPHHVYYTTGAWLNPQGLGPNPMSKGGSKKFYKRRMFTHYNNTFLFRELYFDVDYEMETFEQAAQETKRLLEWYQGKTESSEKPTIVFSGGKGFHLIDFGWKLKENLFGSQLERYNKLYDIKQAKHPPSVKLQQLDRAWKTWFVKRIKREGILIDYDVTPDPRRIIRLPGTIHGKRGRVCQIINADELDTFEPGPALW